MLLAENPTIDCPLCGSKKYKLFGQCEKSLLKVVQCEDCKLLYVNPRPSPKEREQFFKEEYITNDTAIDVWYGSMREESLQYIKSLIQQHKTNGKILDIGCAGGLFLSLFDRDSWELNGVEPSVFAGENAREKYGIKVHTGTLLDTEYPDNYFDVITILDAFYIIDSPTEYILEIQRILKKDGVLVIDIPGLTFRLIKNTGLLGKLFYGNSCQLNPKVQLFFYSDRTLRQMLNKGNFIVSDVDLAPPSLYGNTLLISLLKLYYSFVKFLYAVSLGKLNLASKVVYIFKSEN
jgi:2-polyprenyl-3-methyl-5-hydroxy-6-metoxy-1,4-benzoquinol methylase